MPVTRNSALDCEASTDIGNRIMDLKEIIADKLAEKEDIDAGLLTIELGSLIDQQRSSDKLMLDKAAISQQQLRGKSNG